MGCLFAARFCDAGFDTVLVDHDETRTRRLAQNGVTVESASGTRSAYPTICTAVPAARDLVLVLTKSSATHSLRIPGGQPTLTLQNGLGNAEMLAETVGSEWVLAGSTSQAATLLDEGRVYHAAEGPTVFGAWTTCGAEMPARMLRQAGFQTRLTDRPPEILWEKAIASTAINPLTALFDVKNGRLLDCEASRGLLRELVTEASSVAAAERIQVSGEMVERTEDICRATAGNVSSMLQDLRAGRPTEIEAITGEILRRGERASLPLSVSATVYRLIKGLERRNATRNSET